MARRDRRRRWRWALGGLVALAVAVVALPNAWVWTAAAGHVTDHGDAADDATAPVAIVLGASVYSSGEPSPWLRYRLDVAAELYESGRVDAILVSGDNGQTSYNEPIAMYEYLVSAGIPSEAIAVDYAGFDTYATCVRAQEVFGISEAILVSQDFHEPRAVAVCRAVGVEASGVGDTRARANRSTWAYSWLRERGAAVKAAWDVFTSRTPLLGDRETSVDEAVAWTRANREA
ncbi:protein SanA, affects membrane permeability for vancomycin [Actinomyces ruminicola]|uniref:Protein SanA, affects membrane permeability for vancomycin n=1 Tax=Actinomyces ruminicola TaxID=332524 RepID=A0A1H0A3K3_9ACTO|nr:ElyC/SanA/YdcF family protein [Actinomyces ruminicola]SDN27821.1 protein SanA, affects membrane permeability for vancomycin [Actinomyces ruminicola]